MKSKKIFRIVSLAMLGTTVMTCTPRLANAAWKQNNTGWWYDYGNSYAKGWKQINNVWYYFDNYGYMKTGWVNDNGTWYYLKNSGAMATGWLYDNGAWYYLQDSGAMQTGWSLDNGTWYYLRENGSMVSNEMIIYEDERYYLDNSGAMYTGWKDIDDATYYFTESGEAAREYCTIGNDLYYFSDDSAKLLRDDIQNGVTTDKEGKVIHDYNTTRKNVWRTKHGKRYYLDSNGNKTIGWLKIEKFVGDAKYYYFNSDGFLQTGWFEVDGKTYYADSSKDAGYICTGIKNIDNKLYSFNENGVLITDQGLHTNNEKFTENKYYINEEGCLDTGWKTIGSTTYYFTKDGYAAKGMVKPDNDDKTYYFDCITSELVCNADNYGFTTDTNGAIKQIKEESIKSLIVKNDSKELDKLQELHGDVTFKFAGLDTLVNSYIPPDTTGYIETDIRDESSNIENLKLEREQVLTYVAEVKSKKDGNLYRKPYYVLIKDGTVYTQPTFNAYIGSFSIHKLYKIVNNEIKERYTATDQYRC